jgi:hypothetical protein
VAISLSGAASAQVTTGPTSLDTVGTPTSNDGGLTTSFGYEDTHLETPTFYEYLTINNFSPGMYSIVLGTSSGNVDFTAFDSESCGADYLSCDGTYLTDLLGTVVYPLIFGSAAGSNETWYLVDTLLGADSYLFFINGENRGTGSLGGSITITSGAVPEPGTWAMMLLGFAGVGMAVRHGRRKSQSLQTA